MNAYECLNLAVADGIATVELNRPARANAFNRRLWDEFRAVFVEIDRTPEARVAVLTGAGAHFCAGIDLEMLGTLLPGAAGRDACAGRVREEIRGFVLDLQDVVNGLERCRKPVIAAIHGVCLGAGIDLVSACDLRYCTADARFALKEIDMGVVADAGALQRLPRLIGDAATREIAYTGREFRGPEAEKRGFVATSFESRDAMLRGVMDIAALMAAKSPLTLRGCKAVINHARDHSILDGMDYVATWNAAMLQSDDLAEAMQAQQQKRPAKFRD